MPGNMEEPLKAMAENEIEGSFCGTKQGKYLLNSSNKQEQEFNVLVRKLLEVRHQEGTRPFPVLLVGKEVDLYGLFLRVRAVGGYNVATSSHMWPKFSEDLGLGVECGPGLKLVYAKYLKSLERWTQTTGKEDKNKQSSQLLTNAKMNALYPSCSGHPGFASTNKVDNFVSPNPKLGECYLNSESSLALVDYDERVHESPFKRRRYEKNQGAHLVEDSVASRSPLRSPDRKKDEAIANVLIWIKRLALNPGDRMKGQGPRGSKHNEVWVKECAIYASRIRALLWRKDSNSLVATGSMSKLKIPPSLYYQEIIPPKQALDRLRATQERIAIYGEHQRALVRSDYRGVTIAAPWGSYAPMEGFSARQLSEESNSFYNAMNEMVSLGRFETHLRKRIPIGSYFQAHVPDGKASSPGKRQKISCYEEEDADDDDMETSRFFGTVVWPANSGSYAEELPARWNNRRVGFSFPDPEPEPIEYVRLQIKEARDRLKMQLGRLFGPFGFDDMGEAVVVGSRWLQEEEWAFQSTVAANPASLERSFWEDLPSALPRRTMKELVSYYFNVFVLRKRADQNRAAALSIDSDDDGAQFRQGAFDASTTSAAALSLN